MSDPDSSHAPVPPPTEEVAAPPVSRTGPSAEPPFLRKVLIVAFTVLLLLALRQVSLVLILTFGGALVAVALHCLSDPLERTLKIPQAWALLLVILFSSCMLLGFLDVFGTLAVRQFTALYHRFPAALEAVRTALSGSVFGRHLLSALPDLGAAVDHAYGVLPLAGGILGVLGEGLLVLVAGVYFAVAPGVYVQGVLRLVPASRRHRAQEVLAAIGVALSKWLTGMCVDMLMMGGMTFLGLSFIGMPAPFALAVLAGVGVFIPYIGPAITVIPGMLLAISVSPSMALYAALVYAVALTIEGNISQPMLQRWAVSLPPVVNLLAILVFSPLFGIWGAVLATPLSITVWVAVRMIYIEDILDGGRA